MFRISGFRVIGAYYETRMFSKRGQTIVPDNNFGFPYLAPALKGAIAARCNGCSCQAFHVYRPWHLVFQN